uniref:Coiled-coil protein 142 C-terminal domain-containing protein n=1 Tax=Echeneis naucrates TaxID=173247 RepID=A0A665V5E3_ECHNA
SYQALFVNTDEHCQKQNNQKTTLSLYMAHAKLSSTQLTLMLWIPAGSGSQGCIFRSLQQAETLISTTFNPSLRWLFHNRGQDQEAEEEHFVVVHDLVSQSSARLLRLQQALMTVSRELCVFEGGHRCVSNLCVSTQQQVYVPGIRAEGHYRTLWRLLEQRSLLLFIHEYTRRARLATVFVGRVSQLLEELLNRSYLHQVRVTCRTLWDHLNHWSCLFSKVQSDYYLRPLLVRQTGLLIKMKHSLDSLSLQALVLMEHYVRVILSAVAQTELDSVPLEVLKDMLAGTEVYNQAVEEQRALHNTTQLRTSVLQQAHHSTLGPGLPHSSDHHPAALTIKEVTLILAVHHAEAAAQQMLCWSSPQSCQVCLVHHNHEDYNSFVPPIIRCGTCKQRSDWSWEQLRSGDCVQLCCSEFPFTVSISQWLALLPQRQKSFVFDCLCRSASLGMQSHAGGFHFESLWKYCTCSMGPWSAKTHQFFFPFPFLHLPVLYCLTFHLSPVLCRGLGSALKDKSLTDLGPSVMSSSRMLSATMKHFLLLSPPLLLCLCCKPAKSSGKVHTADGHRVGLLLATVQLSTVWVFSKAYHFLSSWSLNRFLLITQGDLKVGLVFRNLLLSHTDRALQLLLRHRVQELERTLSSLVLKTFANDCKKISREIFEQKMPSSVHWRHSYRTGFPSSPSEYVSLAAQTVIGQVLEGVAPLSDHAHVQALSITMTAFLEAWMEHILKHKIRFSVQGALQLKQDFDYIKDLIQSDRYGLSAELHQHLLSLQVFQQVDSAVFCLLQQPEAKPYLKTRTWKHFTHCCPTNNRDSTDEAVGSSITNLGYVEGEDLTPADPAVFVSNFPSVDPSIPGEPYLAPSLALDAAQQEWLNLRIHCSARRWKLPRLQCLSKSET